MGRGNRDPDLRARSYLDTPGLGLRRVVWSGTEMDSHVLEGCQFSHDASPFVVRLVHTPDMRALMGLSYGIGDAVVAAVVVVLGGRWG